MSFHPYSRPQEPERSGTSEAVPPGSELVFTEWQETFQKSDKELLEFGYMSDCTVICRDVKWSTHKAILCSRNKWFRMALDGPFKVKLILCTAAARTLIDMFFTRLQEGSTGVVTIEDTDPDAVQAVLEYIYTGETSQRCPTPAKVVEMWKAGDFFDIRDLVLEAENALMRRIKASAEFFRFNPKPQSKIGNNGTDCKTVVYSYSICNHLEREHRACGVRLVQPQIMFHLCEPEYISYRDTFCANCQMLYLEGGGGGSPAQIRRKMDPNVDMHVARSFQPNGAKAPDRPTPPDDKTRAMIEDEIRALCEALLVATIDTPQGSRMQKLLIDHMCNTRVAAWGGFTVCRFLEW